MGNSVYLNERLEQNVSVCNITNVFVNNKKINFF